MNTQGKIDLALDPAKLRLHQEGIFYKLYDLHVLLFPRQSKPLKIKVKSITTAVA